ncbi:putative acetyltransferase [Xenococcus sp. PCC 7305]|uniref:GNAT family N-acetyltransferase n=1 Tax=Xenococcus sp. PCC 7305 TaxID=102125 RepID=UPI0002AC7E69|nr:N-acetyltransferase [Xenococcus sp. PCC 7305]ELS00752.1 putative acetyltransferase [Xenococcus sp. PCC 7305]
MQIREANIKDSEGIKSLHLQAFDDSEAKLVSDLAVNLLHEKSTIKIISLVAIYKDTVIGHVTFSPVFLDSTGKHFGYILAPLAVLPAHQNQGAGSKIVKHGLDTISSLGAFIVFVYGDPQYYSRFGFKKEPAQNFTPPYVLEYPEGWQAMKLNSAVFPEGSRLTCVNSLNDPQLW